MPDIFGLPTQEEQAALAQQQQLAIQEANKQRFAALMQNSSGVGRGGLAIGNALGKGIGGLFRGKQEPAVQEDPLKEAKGIALTVFEQQAPHIGAKKAQAQAMRVMSIQLRHANMPNEATQLTLQADEIDNAENLRLRALEDAKVASAQAKKTLERTDTPVIVDLLDEQAKIEAQIDSEGSTTALDNRLRVIKRAIAKDVAITGRTETDALVDNLVTPTAANVTSLQKHLDEAGAQLDLITSIGDTFKPEFLTLPSKLVNMGRAAIEKLGVPLTGSSKKGLSEFTEFRQKGIDGLNRYIKFITGAQMSEAEASRLRKGFPDVENDSATEFIAKYRGSVKQLLAARRRAQASLREEGLNLLPSDFKEGFGAPLSDFAPDDAFVDDLLGFGPTQPVVSPEAEDAVSDITSKALSLLGE